MFWQFTRQRFWVMVLIVLSLGACDSTEQTTDNQHPLINQLPASFSGQLPCADCPAIDIQLNLFADQSFYLKRHYQDRPPGEFYALGRWRQQRGSLKLISNADVPQFLISTSDTLQWLDQQGRVIGGEDNHTLYRDPVFRPVYPSGQFNGMYRHTADEAVFAECQTGQIWSVAPIGDSPRLQSLYEHYARQPNQPLYAEVTGRLTAIESPVNGADVTGLIVEESFHIWPAESCGEPGFQEKLLGTRWHLTRIHQTPVETETFSEQPYLQLSTDTDQFSGSDGCNQLIGRFRLDENKLRFSKLASTRKACPVEPLSAQTLYIAMEQVQHWQIEQHQLILENAQGETLLRYEAEGED